MARVLRSLALGVTGLVVITAAAAATIAIVFARAIVTPPRSRAQDVGILAVDDATVTLSATIDSLTPGRYSLWFAKDGGHARIGEVLTLTDTTVTRELLGVDVGTLTAGTRGRLGAWFYLGPADLGLEFEEVAIQTELGDAPAWLIPSATPSDRWVIQVHGRAVRRPETLRAVPVFRDLDYTSLLISYRNDGDAPRSPDNRYALGDAEWRDVESAMQYALDNGARHLVLMGWSMGGATVLQAATRSRLTPYVAGLVLDSPVVDWVTALQYQGVANRLPRPVRWATLELLSRRWAGLLTGQQAPIDLKRLDLVTRASSLTTPILLLHSDGDGYVPATASIALAAARPDIVTFERFTVARHVRMWNYDPERWTAAISRWLTTLEESSGKTRTHRRR